MRKRLTAGLVATTAALAMTGTPTAFADDSYHGNGYHNGDDHKPPKPCNPYPPGKKYHITASPTSATIRKNTNIDVVAFVTRGQGNDAKPCKHHLVILRFKDRPKSKVLTHRTGDRGTAAFVIQHVTTTTSFYFDLLYNDTLYHSNGGVIRVR